jgi:hypothetical protein
MAYSMFCVSPPDTFPFKLFLIFFIRCAQCFQPFEHGLYFEVN